MKTCISVKDCYQDWIDSTEQRWVTQQTVRCSASVVWGASRLFCPVVPLRTPMGGGSLLFTTVVSPYRYIFLSPALQNCSTSSCGNQSPKLWYILVVVTSPCVWTGIEWFGCGALFNFILLLTRVTESKGWQSCLEGLVALVTIEGKAVQGWRF